MTQEQELPPLSRVVRDLAGHDAKFREFIASDQTGQRPHPVNVDPFGLYGPSAMRYLITSLLLDSLSATIQRELGGEFRYDDDSHYDPFLSYQFDKLRNLYLSSTLAMHRIFDPTQWDPSGPMVPPATTNPLDYVDESTGVVNDIMIAHSILHQDALVMFHEELGAFQIAVGDAWLELPYTERLKVTKAGSDYMFGRAQGMSASGTGELHHNVLIADTIMYLHANHNISNYVDVESVIAELTNQ